MFHSGHLSGGASLLKKLKLGKAVTSTGTIAIAGATTEVGIIPCGTTSFANAYGLTNDAATYSSTQGATEGIVTVNVRPDQIIRARMSGGATDGTVLVSHTNTSASAGGTTLTASTLSAQDMDGGIIWCISGNNVGLSRSITAFTASTSCVVTVPFPRAIAVGDIFLATCYNWVGTGAGGADGPMAVTTSTLLLEANADAASGSGGDVSVVDLELNGASNSYVLFKLRNHVHDSDALVS